ncbi:MAG: helix-turn-helix domain-containing protein [Burkholderia sp.]
MLKKVDVQEVALAATEGARSAAVDAASAAEFKRWSVGRKRAVVLRLLRGESIDAVSREVGVTIAELEQWRELALAGIEAGLKSRQTDPLEVKLKEAVHRVGELTMEVEMLRMERERQERRPLSVRSSST